MYSINQEIDLKLGIETKDEDLDGWSLDFLKISDGFGEFGLGVEVGWVVPVEIFTFYSFI